MSIYPMWSLGKILVIIDWRIEKNNYLFQINLNFIKYLISESLKRNIFKSMGKLQYIIVVLSLQTAAAHHDIEDPWCVRNALVCCNLVDLIVDFFSWKNFRHVRFHEHGIFRGFFGGFFSTLLFIFAVLGFYYYCVRGGALGKFSLFPRSTRQSETLNLRMFYRFLNSESLLCFRTNNSNHDPVCKSSKFSGCWQAGNHCAYVCQSVSISRLCQSRSYYSRLHN